MVVDLKNKFFDINKLPNDGYLIIPISISNMNTTQTPKKCYEVLDFFYNKIDKIGIDVIYLYTNGLYFNSENTSFTVREKTNNQIIDHCNELRKIIIKKKKYMPQAIHFVPWDYILLNAADKYKTYISILQKQYSSNPEFIAYANKNVYNHKPTKANINFILEEIAINHIIREKYVDLPKTLVKADNWRLIIYPGEYLFSDVYIWQKNILPHNKLKVNIYSGAQYNLNTNKLYLFKNIEL